MKKITFVFLTLCCCLVFSACENPFGSDKKIKLDPWGDNQNLSFFTTEDGRKTSVLNDDGKKVLDVTNNDAAKIIRDKVSGECRLIRVDTAAGKVEKKYADGGGTYVQTLYKYNYYDTFGKLLIKDASYGISSVVDFVAMAKNNEQESFLISLSDGKTQIVPSGVFVSDKGFIYPDKDGTVILDKEGKYVKTVKDIFVESQVEYYNGKPAPNLWVLDVVRTRDDYNPEKDDEIAWNENNIYYDDEKQVEGDKRDFIAAGDTFDITVAEGTDSELLKPNHFFSYYKTASANSDGFSVGIMDSEGKQLTENKYNGVAALSEKSFVGFGAKESVILDAETMKETVLSNMPMTYFDGKTSIVSGTSGEGFFLVNAAGEKISDAYQELKYLGGAGEEKYFQGVNEEGKNFVMNSEGNILTFETAEGETPSYTCLKDGTFAVSSVAGQYLIDAQGVIQKVFRTYVNYTYDSDTNKIKYAEGEKAMSRLFI